MVRALWHRTWPFLATLVVISGLGAGVLWAYGGFESRPRLPPEPPPHPCAPDPAAAPVLPNQLAETALPYRGPGPHQVFVVHLPGHGAGAGGPWWEAASLPPGWEPSAGSAAAPLVLCEYGNRLGRSVDRCEYGYGSLPSHLLLTSPREPDPGAHGVALEAAEYHYRLYEAKTGTLLDEFTIGGTGGCAPTVTVIDGVWPVSVVQSPDSEGLANRLRPFVEAATRTR